MTDPAARSDASVCAALSERSGAATMACLAFSWARPIGTRTERPSARTLVVLIALNWAVVPRCWRLWKIWTVLPCTTCRYSKFVW